MSSDGFEQSAEKLCQQQIEKIRNYIINANSWVEINQIAKDFGVKRHDNLVKNVKNTTIAHLINSHLKRRGFQTCRINYQKDYSIWVAPDNLLIEDLPQKALEGSVSYKPSHSNIEVSTSNVAKVKRNRAEYKTASAKYGSNDEWKRFARGLNANPYFKQYLFDRQGGKCSICGFDINDFSKTSVRKNDYDNYCRLEAPLIEVPCPTGKRPDRTRKVPNCEKCYNTHPEFFNECATRSELSHKYCLSLNSEEDSQDILDKKENLIQTQNKIEKELETQKVINIEEVFKETSEETPELIIKEYIEEETPLQAEFSISAGQKNAEGYRKYSANYSFSNPNFVIQNLKEDYIEDIFYPTICILKNILQRGVPTLMSTYLQSHLGALHKRDDFKKSYPLIDNKPPNWQWTIKGNKDKDYYPAKEFFYKNLPEDFSDCIFIQNLLLPEVAINDIVQDDSIRAERFKNQHVDFYLPQVKLVIEIDGSQHKEEEQSAKDKIRDIYLAENKVETIRFSTSELKTKTDSYFEKVKRIKKKLAILFYDQRDNGNRTEIKINEYKDCYLKGVDLINPNYFATAIIRFQILILELLATGRLKFDKAWNLEIFSCDIQGFAEIAIDDLFNWFDNLFILRNIIIQKPTINIKYVGNHKEFSVKDSIKIDFSLLKRYTDENILNPEIIYVRTDYFDDYDYFKVSTAKLIEYPPSIIKNEQALLFLAWNLILQSYDNLEYKNLKFREGQLEIIANALIRRHTIGLLPTGSGKSICYQLASLLQPAISFVVCPIKSLMIDQAVDLENAMIHRIKALTSDNSTEEKEFIQKEFKRGKYFFVFISPERFQIQKFRDYLTEINNELNIAYAVIDEAHCLSEWGHDFRTSYLNLVSAINRYCSNFRFIALTATASANVLKDLKIELQLEKDADIKTPKKYSREELSFLVKDVSGRNNKYVELKNLLQHYLSDVFFKDKCGVVFTPAVNGKKGCYEISNNLTKTLNQTVNFYSGEAPNDYQGMPFPTYKQLVQNEFKDSKGTILVTTKAFGMGVNKGNIGYTVHYGIPASMESLYQEAGRAGRAKTMFAENKAECTVLLSKETILEEELDSLWDKETSLENIKDIQKRLYGDIGTQLFFLTLSEKGLNIEVELLKLLYEYICNANTPFVLIKNAYQFIEILKEKFSLESSLDVSNIEKAIFKLKQIGIVKDWTVTFLGGGYKHFLLEVDDLSSKHIKNTVEKSIAKYDNEFSLSELSKGNNKYNKLAQIYKNAEYNDFEKFARILLQWNYDTFFYSRRQSLKNVYEACTKVADGIFTTEEFKKNIENYFRFSNKSHIMQVIADNPLGEISKWFDILFVYEDSVKTEEPIKEKDANGLISSISRFLESYQQNTGLDFISGLLRLIANDFGNIDGRKRFESSLREIKNYDFEKQKYIFNNLFMMVKRMNLSKDKKNQLAESVANVYDNKKEILFDLYENLEDDYSLKIISKDFLNRINKIKTKIEVGNE